jgi:hypothetical protein
MLTPPGRLWFPFRLRTLLVVIAALAIPLAWIAKERGQSHRELKIAAQLTELGCDIRLGGPYDDVELLKPDKPQNWWRRLAGQLLGERIYLVHGLSHKFDDFTQLAQLKNIHWISVSGGSVEDLTPLSGLTTLKLLMLSNVPVRDLKPLAGLASLENLSLNSLPVEDLTPLAGLKTLKHLGVFDSPVTKEQVDALRPALPDCKLEHSNRFLESNRFLK